jgi:hypothetical protein
MNRTIIKRLIIDGTYGNHKRSFHQESDQYSKSFVLAWKRYCKKYLNEGYTITLETYKLIRTERIK